MSFVTTRNSIRDVIRSGLFLLPMLLALSTSPVFAHYHVSTTGSDNHGDGSAANPWATIAYALKSVPRAGGVDIFVGEGTYDGLIRIESDIEFEHKVRVRAAQPYRARLTFSKTNTVMYLKGGNYTFEGFEILGDPVGHTGAHTPDYVFHVVFIESAHHITFKDNVIHDSYAKDLMTMIKSNDMIIEGNIFYNQSGWDEHIDVNIGSHDIEIRENIFFNDFEGSGRANRKDTAAFIVIKTSAEPEPLTNTVNVRRNVFMHYQGAAYHLIRLGEDDRYPNVFEAEKLLFENNLLLLNGSDPIKSVFGTWGVRDVTIRANTIVATTPLRDFLANLGKGPKNNPSTSNVLLVNNILADMTGTMGRLVVSPSNQFVSGTGTLRNNLYWNNGKRIPNTREDDINYTDDPSGIIGDPRLPNSAQAVVPRLTAKGFQGGYNSIRQAFLGIVSRYGKPNGASAVVGAADKSQVPVNDIRGKKRDESPDIGAFEIGTSVVPSRPMPPTLAPIK